MASPASSSSPTEVKQLFQHVVVMRHGDRIDNSEPMWTLTAARPWDPPLDDGGKTRAFIRGRKFRNKLAFPIHRVLVSPFLRCVQTASEVVAALCAVDDVDVTRMSSDGLSIDPSKLKVSIEYGLCEMLNTAAIRSNVAPTDGNFSFNLAELESLFPAGTVDHFVERVYQELPRWQETVDGARERYVNITKALADKYPSENLLLVTHGEGVGCAVSTHMKGMTVLEVEYCAYAHLQRPVSVGESKAFTAGDFELLLPIGQTGIKYCPTSVITDDLS